MSTTANTMTERCRIISRIARSDVEFERFIVPLIRRIEEYPEHREIHKQVGYLFDVPYRKDIDRLELEKLLDNGDGCAEEIARVALVLKPGAIDLLDPNAKETLEQYTQRIRENDVALLVRREILRQALSQISESSTVDRFQRELRLLCDD